MVPNLATLDQAVFDVAVAFYASGYAAGRQAAEDDMAAAWAALAARIRRMADVPTTAELAERRAA